MSVRVDVISGELCDHCNRNDARPIVRFRTRSPETGPIQLWIHRDCLRKLMAKADKLLLAVEA